MKTTLRILALSALMLCIFLPQAARAATIANIDVKGTERIEPATVLSYIDLKIGDTMTQEGLDGALKSLFATGLFADVNVAQNNNTLVIQVVENPVINEIAFEGNDKLEDEELLAEIQLRPRQVFTRTKVQSDLSRLYQMYRRDGRFSVTIEPKLIKLDQNRVNLVFEINEGEVTSIETISFVGNEHYSDGRLREEISTKEGAWYRFLSTADRYDPDRLSYDQEMLRKFYLSQGYADFNISSAVAELSDDKGHFFVTFTLEEGQRYKLGEVKIDSRLRNFDASVLNPHLEKLSPGDWYDADRVQEVADRLTDALGDLQYAFVNVKPNLKRNREGLTVDVTYEINETPRVFVERIDIDGNVRTMDKVIRREMLLAEGDPFNKSKLSRSEQRIRNLDYFENVEVGLKQGSAPDKTVIDVGVAEKSTGELSLGAGFSTSDGPLADIRIREKNLLGKGQDLLFATTIAGKRTEFDASFTEPYFLNRDISAGVDLFHITRDLQDESSFDQRRTGGALRMGYPLSERWRQTLKYRVEQNDITDVQADASFYIRSQEGKRVTSAVSQRTTYDNRDSTIFPTDGWLLWLDTEISGLGGDSQYVSGQTGASFFYPVMDQVTLNLLGEVGSIQGYGDEDVVINERFFLGGSTLRGFEKAGVGPRDVTSDDSLGGNFFYRGTAEVAFPLGLPDELGIQGHAFSDVGSLWDVDTNVLGGGIVDENKMRVSTGVGVSWRSPFGPVRADVSFPVVKEDYDQEEIFRFDFGTRF